MCITHSFAPQGRDVLPQGHNLQKKKEQSRWQEMFSTRPRAAVSQHQQLAGGLFSRESGHKLDR